MGLPEKERGCDVTVMFSTILFYEAPPTVGVGHELRIINLVDMSTRFHYLEMIGSFD